MDVFNLQASVNLKDQVTQGLKNIQSEAQVTDSKLESFSTKVSRMGEGLSNIGQKLTTGVTLPLVGLVAAVFKVGNDFDAQMSRVKAISGATADEFKKLRDQAIQLGADTSFSAKQAAEGMENLASAGFNTNEIMVAMPGMLDLAASSGEDLANSADIAASTLRGFGLEADKAGHVADVLAKNAAQTNAAVGDTGLAMKYVAPVARAMGLSLEEVTAAIGEMSNAGIKGEQAGTTLRGALTRLANPSKPAADAMAAIGFSAFDASGKMLSLKDMVAKLQSSLKGLTDEEKQQKIAAIFGTEALSGMLTLVQAGPDELDKMTQSLVNSDGAARDMATTMQDNTKSEIEQMMGSLETLAIKLKDLFDPQVRGVIKSITEFINKLSSMNAEQLQTIAKLAGFAAALGPALVVLGKLADGVGVVNNGLSILGGGLAAFPGKVIGGLNSAKGTIGSFVTFISSKFGFIGTFIVAKLSPLGGIISGIFAKIAAPFTAIFTKIGALIPAQLAGIGGKLTAGFALVGGKVLGGLQSIVGLALKMVAPAAFIGLLLVGLGLAYQQLGPQIDNIINMVIQKGPTLIQNFTAKLLERIPDLINAGTTLLMKLMEALIANAPALIQAAVAIITSLVNGVTANIPQLIPVVIQLIGVILNAIVENLPQIIMAGLNLLVALAQGIANNIDKMVPVIVDVIIKIIQVIAQNLPQIIEAGIKILVAVIQGISRAIPQLVAAMPAIFSAIVSALAGMDWGSIGRNIIEGIKAGVSAVASGLANTVKNAAQAALNGVKSFLGIHSPSTKFRDEVGQFIPEGIAAGVQENGSVINDELKKLSDNMEFSTDVKATMNASSRLNLSSNMVPGASGVSKANVNSAATKGQEIAQKMKRRAEAVTKIIQQPVQLVLKDGRLLAEIVAENYDVVDRYNNREPGGNFVW